MNSLSDIISEKKDEFDIPVEAPTTEETPIDPQPQEPQPVDTAQLAVMLHGMKNQIDAMIRMVSGEQVRARRVAEPEAMHAPSGERVIEGVFDGEKMIGSDGKEYSIPPNYASKSKLVEGDMMKLTITNAGSFLYKQIGPIERKRIVGELVCDAETNQWSVAVGGRPYKILTASVTFYKGKAGDECVILVPESGESSWGAVENIIAK